MNFGERLKDLRKQKNLTQSELAEFLKINSRTYLSYENNEREVNFKTLIKIADFFNVSVDYLLCRTEKSTSNEETYLLNIFRQLSPEGKEKIKIYAEDISELENYRSHN